MIDPKKACDDIGDVDAEDIFFCAVESEIAAVRLLTNYECLAEDNCDN
jgi:hypothetical protein